MIKIDSLDSSKSILKLFVIIDSQKVGDNNDKNNPNFFIIKLKDYEIKDEFHKVKIEIMNNFEINLELKIKNIIGGGGFKSRMNMFQTKFKNTSEIKNSVISTGISIKDRQNLLKSKLIINKGNSPELNKENNLNSAIQNSEHNDSNVNKSKEKNSNDNKNINKKEKDISQDKINNKSNVNAINRNLNQNIDNKKHEQNKNEKISQPDIKKDNKENIIKKPEDKNTVKQELKNKISEIGKKKDKEKTENINAKIIETSKKKDGEKSKNININNIETNKKKINEKPENVKNNIDKIINEVNKKEKNNNIKMLEEKINIENNYYHDEWEYDDDDSKSNIDEENIYKEIDDISEQYDEEISEENSQIYSDEISNDINQMYEETTNASSRESMQNNRAINRNTEKLKKVPNKKFSLAQIKEHKKTSVQTKTFPKK